MSGTEQMILGWYTRINPVLFYKLLRTVCTSRMTRDMLYLQCCPTDTRQREEVSFLSAIKNKKKPPVFALLRASFFLSTWTCYFFSPTGIIAYADQEINMQVILKHSETNKKSKLFPWFMPYFSLIFTNVEQLVKGYLQIRKHNQM